jgi:hypothetical protein
MTICCRAALAIAIAFAASVPATAQESGRYRDFQLGASVTAISTLTDTRRSDVTVVHERPALMQELRWMPSSFGPASRSRGEGIELVVFGFYENQLYRLAIDYDRSATKGMTDRDMVDAISSIYGPPSSSNVAAEGTDGRGAEAVASRIVARWNGPGYAVAATRWSYGGAWRLVVESTALATLAHAADTRAIALDVQQGPQQEAERARRDQQNKDDATAAARTANKAVFQP